MHDLPSRTVRQPLAGPALAAGFAAILLLSGCASSQPQTAPITLRVMTYNIHHGEGPDGRVDLLRIADAIKQARADIVALQEVDRGVERTRRRDLPAELEALTGMSSVFSNNFHVQGGEYGNAVLTRFPVLRRENTHFRMLRPGEQRGVLQLLLDVDGRSLLFLNTHLDYRPDDAERLANVEEINRLVGRHGSLPVIICGDFNDTPDSRMHRKLKESFRDVWELVGQGSGFTFSSDQPRKRIDYIWISPGGAVAPFKAWIPQSEASDHLPLVAVMQLY